MPWSVSAAAGDPVTLGRGIIGMEEVQGRTLLPSNLAVLRPRGRRAGRHRAARSIDLFTLWTLALLIFGYHVAARVSKGTAAGLVVAAWLLLGWGSRSASAGPSERWR